MSRVVGGKALRIKLLILWSVMLSLPSAAWAAWIRIGSDVSGSVWYMDPDRVENAGARVHAWVKIDSARDRSVKYRQAMRLYSSICSSKKIKLLSYSLYDSYGKVIETDSTADSAYSDYDYKYVTPDSMGEAVLQASCGVAALKNE